MADFTEIKKEREDIQSIFDNALSDTSIPTFVRFRLLGNNKLKQLYKIQKLSDLYVTLSEGLNFAVVINEEIFDQLTDDMQVLMFEEVLNGVFVDMEHEKITLEQPDFSTYSGLLAKHGADNLIRYKESVKSLIEAKLQKEKDEKQAKLDSKRRKK